MFFFFLGASQGFDSPSLERFAQALETTQINYPGMTLAMLTTLLAVARAPTKSGDLVSVSDIADRSSMLKYPTIARQLELLGTGNVTRPGLALVDKQTDPLDRRLRYVALSSRGKKFLYELDLVLNPSSGPRDDTQ